MRLRHSFVNQLQRFPWCTVLGSTEESASRISLVFASCATADDTEYAGWLGEKAADAATLNAMLKPCLADQLEACPVNPKVGNVRNEGAELVGRVMSPLTER